MALDWTNVDLARGLIRVVGAYDPKAHEFIETKNRRKRNVPIPAALRDYLIEHKLRSGKSDGLVFRLDTNAPRRGTAHMGEGEAGADHAA